MLSTEQPQYAERLQTLESVWWKRLLNVQAPYRLHLQALKPGFTLDVGCGVGRNLRNLDGHGVGVDHNADSIQACRAQGFQAFTGDGFKDSPFAKPGKFDSMLLSHVAEHMTVAEAIDLIKSYQPYIKPGGKLIVITPQEVGYRSDPTHIEFIEFKKLKQIAAALSCPKAKTYSFPLPRFFGKVFKYNEFNLVAQLPATQDT